MHRWVCHKAATALLTDKCVRGLNEILWVRRLALERADGSERVVGVYYSYFMVSGALFFSYHHVDIIFNKSKASTSHLVTSL